MFLGNSNETYQLMVPFWTLTTVTFKSRSNQKPGYYVLYPYPMYLWYKFRDDSAISSGVSALFVFSVLAPVAKPKIRLDRNLVCELLIPSGTCTMLPVNSSSGYKTDDDIDGQRTTGLTRWDKEPHHNNTLLVAMMGFLDWRRLDQHTYVWW
jgi:hypothetical protein